MSSLRNAVRELDETRSGGGAAEGGRCGARLSPSPAGGRRRPELEQGRWADLPPELLVDVMQRVEASEASWPARSHVVACAAVCRSWREAVQEVVGSPEISGRITFPVSLKQPGPRDKPIQCFIRRERKTGTFHLYLGLSPALQADNEKLLLSARKIRRATSTDYMISLASNNFSRASSSYIGKLRPNFLGTKFTLYDSQPPCNSAVMLNRSSSPRIHPKQVSPNVPAGRYKVATISYEVSVLQTRGPRRMHCTMHSIPTTVIQEGGTASTPSGPLDSLDQQFSALSLVKPWDTAVGFSSTSLVEPPKAVQTMCRPLYLKNKAPRWHEQLQCWCLNFRGRVTVASVKNFQLVVAADPSHQVPAAEQERVILQFGKIGKDIFTMDYQYPLSAFQAFAICLSSFDNKPLRE